MTSSWDKIFFEVEKIGKVFVIKRAFWHNRTKYPKKLHFFFVLFFVFCFFVDSFQKPVNVIVQNFSIFLKFVFSQKKLQKKFKALL